MVLKRPSILAGVDFGYFDRKKIMFRLMKSFKAWVWHMFGVIHPADPHPEKFGEKQWWGAEIFGNGAAAELLVRPSFLLFE